MKAKYLGKYYYHSPYGVFDVRLTNENDEDDYYPADLFMRSEDTIFHAIISESNTSAIAAKISDDGELIKLWRIW